MAELQPQASRVDLLVDHYQKTHELVQDLWRQRNSFFMWLLVIVGIAILLSSDLQDTDSLLITILASLLGIDDPAQIDHLQHIFPYSLFQSVLLFVTLYLMANLFSRHSTILRLYGYLAILEHEIHQALGFTRGYIFLRESDFYTAKRNVFQRGTKFIYSAMVSLMIMGFLVVRGLEHASIGVNAFMFIDSILALAVLYYLLAYLNIVLRREAAVDREIEETVAEAPTSKEVGP